MTNATTYRKQLATVRGTLAGVQQFDRTMLRATRIAELSDQIQTLELLVDVCEREGAEECEALAAGE